MLSLPSASKAVTPDGKRPALISVIAGTPSAVSFSSTKKVPVGRRSRARTALRVVRSAGSATTVLARDDNEKVPLGLFPAAK